MSRECSRSTDKHLKRPLRILRLPDVRKRVGLSKSQIYKLISEDAFPRQIRLGGGRASGWVEFQVNLWIEQRIAESRKEAV